LHPTESTSLARSLRSTTITGAVSIAARNVAVMVLFATATPVAAAADPAVETLATSTPASPARWSWQADLGVTLLSRPGSVDASVKLARAQAIGASIDRRSDHVHVFVRGEANSWRDQRDDGSNDFVLTLDLGLGLRLDFAGGYLRSSAAAGGTLLVVPTDVDKAGTFGAFADVRPLAFVWPLAQVPGTRIGLAPLSLTLAIPVLAGIPLVSIQYRTTVFAERDF
jgi:hypothetical protein